MKLATIRTAAGTTRAARAEAGRYVDLGAGDVGELLRHDGWQERPATPRRPSRPSATRP